MIADDPRFAEGIACFDAGHYFEAHEVWEDLWRALPRAEHPGGDRLFVQGLIQLAVSLEHWRRGNPRGARGQWQKALAKLSDCGDLRCGVPLARLLAETAAFYAARDLAGAEALAAAGAWTAPAWEPAAAPSIRPPRR